MGARFSAPVQTGPGAHPASCTVGTRSFPGVKSDRGVTLTPHPLLVPWSRKSVAIPLLPLWAVRPVQSLRACTTVHFFLFVMEIFLHKNKNSVCFYTYLEIFCGCHIKKYGLYINASGRVGEEGVCTTYEGFIMCLLYCKK